MKTLFTITVLLAAVSAAEAKTPGRSYPSCDLVTGHAERRNGSNAGDVNQKHIVLRTNVLQADIGNARKAGRLNRTQADGLWRQVQTVRANADHLVAQQGFLSAAERATYDRQLDTVSTPICRSARAGRVE